AIEAMSLGVPVIASDVGGLTEIIEHERSGLLVPQTVSSTAGAVRRQADPAALAAAQLRLLGDPAFARAIGQAGQQRVTETFSLASMVDGNVAVYRQIIANHRTGSTRSTEPAGVPDATAR
ncbi:MAG: glycosyltransferase, partial [Myxococcota bacterium]